MNSISHCISHLRASRLQHVFIVLLGVRTMFCPDQCFWKFNNLVWHSVRPTSLAKVSARPNKKLSDRNSKFQKWRGKGVDIQYTRLFLPFQYILTPGAKCLCIHIMHCIPCISFILYIQVTVLFVYIKIEFRCIIGHIGHTSALPRISDERSTA